MANEKNSFVLYKDWGEDLNDLTMEERGMLITAVFEFQATGEVIEFEDRLLNNILRRYISAFRKDGAKWEQTRESRSVAGAKGGRPKKEKANESKKSNCFSEKQTEAKKAVNVNVNVNGNVSTTNVVDEGVDSCCDESFGKVFSAVEKEFGRPISPIESERIKEWVENHNEDLVLHALKTAIIHNKRSFSYIGGILKNWKDNDIRSVYEAEAAGERFKTVKNNKKVGGASHSGVNFDEVYAI